MRFDDVTNETTVSGSSITSAGDWCAPVLFSNGTTATQQAVLGADKIYLAPGSTYTETAKILNTDGSTTSGTPVFAILPNTAALTTTNTVATVNQSTGVITGSNNGMAWIAGMIPNFSGSNLKTAAGTGTECSIVSVASGPGFNSSMNGQLIQITASGAWYGGIYQIAAASNASGTAILQNLSGVDTCPAPGSSTGGIFAAGPTGVGSVFVWPTNSMPCFGANGTIYTSYTNSCFVAHSMFSSAALLTGDAPFNPGPAAWFASSGINTFEAEMGYTPITGA